MSINYKNKVILKFLKAIIIKNKMIKNREKNCMEKWKNSKIIEKIKIKVRINGLKNPV